MKKIALLCSLVASLGVFWACRESALSDIELSDPSILKVYGYVSRYCNLDSTVTKADIISLRIKDKTDHSVELKKGQVLCNNEQLVLKTDLIGPYYRTPEESSEIEDNTSYEFIVELADGEQYSSSVYIDDKHLKSIDVPTTWTWTQNDSLLLSWNELGDNYSTEMVWSLSFKEGVNTTGKTTMGYLTVNEHNYYKFPPAFFTNTAGQNVVKELYIRLTSKKEGQLNSAFRSGNITNKFEFAKKVNIN